MLIKINQFRGEIPRLSDRLLPEFNASTAINTKLWSGNLRAWNGPEQVADTFKDGPIKSIYLYRDGANEYWFAWEDDVDVLSGPLADDDTNIVYFTGSSLSYQSGRGADSFKPQITDNTIALDPSEEIYPFQSYNLGVPAPETKPTVVSQGVEYTGTVTNVTGGGEGYGEFDVTTDSTVELNQTEQTIDADGSTVTGSCTFTASLIAEQSTSGTISFQISRLVPGEDGVGLASHKSPTLEVNGSPGEPDVTVYEQTLEFEDLPESGEHTYFFGIGTTGFGGSTFPELEKIIVRFEGSFGDGSGVVRVEADTDLKSTGTLTISGGLPSDGNSFTLGIFDEYHTILNQDETDFDGAGSNGTFSAGSGYSVSDVITMSDGTEITVDTVSTGAVTAFTVSKATPYGSGGDAANATLTQDSVSPSGGTGFDLTLGDNNETLIEDIAYTFRNTLTSTPFEVQIGGDIEATRNNLLAAINLSGTPGTEYSTGTQEHPDITGSAGTQDGVIDLEAKESGLDGNTLTLASVGGNLSVSGSTMTGATFGLQEGSIVRFKNVGGMSDMNNVDLEVTGVNESEKFFSVSLSTDQEYLGGGTWERISGSETDTDVSRAWVYTWVAIMGTVEQEGPPSPVSDILDTVQDEEVLLSNLETSPPANHNITKMRIYRANTGTEETVFQFVGEADVGATFLDDVTDEELGEAIVSTEWVPPPEDLKGFVEMPGGVFAGFTGKQVCFSVPFQPHAWPIRFRRSVNHTIIGLGVFGNTLTVLTEELNYQITGNEPDTYTMDKMDINYICVSKRGIVDMGYAIAYPATDGLAMIGPGSATLVTESLFTRDEWQALGPQNIIASRYDDRYVAFFDTTE